jgi:hypothetical protein
MGYAALIIRNEKFLLFPLFLRDQKKQQNYGKEK